MSWSKEDRCKRFIEKAAHIHHGKYNYDMVLKHFVDNETKIPIICPEHGEFWQSPHSHLRGHGCSKCADKIKALKRAHTTEWFITKSKEIHGDNYDYSETEYINNKTPITLICHKKDKYGKEHGRFIILPVNHITKHNHCGCPKCSGGVKKSQEDFIKEINERYGNLYDTSKTIYKNSESPVTLVCPIHGEFKIIAYNLLNGCGCPSCHNSVLEEKIRKILCNNNIKYIFQYRNNFLKTKKYGQLSLDFYLPDYNIAIECQGRQHFCGVEVFGGMDELKKTIYRDTLKYDKCKENGISILYYINDKIKNEIDKKHIIIPHIYDDNLYLNEIDLLKAIYDNKIFIYK